MSGVVEPQSFINGIFWQIDSMNVGEVKEGFCQLYYDDDVESVTVTDDDIQKIVEINTGIGVTVGQFRTALVLTHPEVIRLAKLHQSLAKKHGFEVALFTNLEDGFVWRPVKIQSRASLSYKYGCARQAVGPEVSWF